MVTTSDYGPDSYAFAAGKPLVLLSGANLLMRKKGTDLFVFSNRPLMADSVEKVGLAAACRSGVPAVEVAASHFRLPFGVSLSVLAQA
nr:hypothetical protein [Stutzerimonas stutzeri]